ncbi:MAG: hypothetical protein ED859_06205 [Desulfuromonadales bacterium]|nr:MAG: hypothetical protein ED859_06205 [Desulfuromonadales bacterium]
MHARALLSIIPLLFIFSVAEAAARIIELPDRIVVEMVGTPAAPVQPVPPPKSPEPYLVERFAEYPDRYEVELVGNPDQDKRKPAEHQMSASPQPAMLVMQTETVTEPPPSALSSDDSSRTATTSPYYRELSERIRTLQRERQECLKTVPEDSREDRERKRREAEEKLREIRAVSAEMAQLRNGGG